MPQRVNAPMSVDAFLDTNVFLYAASKDPADAGKSQHAYHLVVNVSFGLSLQIVQEFYHNARVKARLGISESEAERLVALMLQRPLVTTNIALFREARRICIRYQLRYWDAALLAAAQKLGAPIFYSEDLNHGQTYNGVRVVNPFHAPTPSA